MIPTNPATSRSEGMRNDPAGDDGDDGQGRRESFCQKTFLKSVLKGVPDVAWDCFVRIMSTKGPFN